MDKEIAEGFVKVILEKYAEPTIKKIAGLGKEGWEKFKIDFDLAFTKYLQKSKQKYSKIKTILYRTEPKYIYDFFECPNLTICRKRIKGNCINTLLDISNFIIIQGTGGIGKSTFLKHLFLNTIEKSDLIPIFIELKELNSLEKEYDITDFIFYQLDVLGSTINKDYLNYALNSGCFLFLLDGYDEIATDKKDVFFSKFDDFCDKYSDNHFIISSRPYSEFIEFQRFSIAKIHNLTQKQSISLIKKIDFDVEIKERFLKALEKDLYNKHQSFASNPLLLSIMLLTFDNYAEIPEKLHLFYSNAFETLYSKHDATKAGYKRELKSGLSYDSFKKVFSHFCFSTYCKNKFELSYDEMIDILKIIAKTTTFEPDKFLFDLINSICVIYKEGLSYKFTHRSFQEYFTAVFLKELSDEYMNKLGINLAKKDWFKASHDNVFFMLRDMAEQRFEQNILLPIIDEFESQSEYSDKYDFYFYQLSPKITYSYLDDYEDICYDDQEIHLLLTRSPMENVINFLYDITKFYIKQYYFQKKWSESKDNELLTLLENKIGYIIDYELSLTEYSNDEEIYSLVKQTWLGKWIDAMAHLKELIEDKCKNNYMDLELLIK